MLSNVMTNQPRLFDDDKRKRKPPRTMMHVCDAGDSGCGALDGDSHIVRMSCSKCGHETDWITVRNVTEGRKGLPCPVCNQMKK